MDNIGIDRLIEEIEARFGRIAANAVFLLILLAIVSFSLGVIHEHMIKPSMVATEEFTRAFRQPGAWDELLRTFVNLGILAVGWLVMWAIARIAFGALQKKLDGALAKGANLATEAKNAADHADHVLVRIANVVKRIKEAPPDNTRELLDELAVSLEPFVEPRIEEEALGATQKVE